MDGSPLNFVDSDLGFEFRIRKFQSLLTIGEKKKFPLRKKYLALTILFAYVMISLFCFVDFCLKKVPFDLYKLITCRHLALKLEPVDLSFASYSSDFYEPVVLLKTKFLSLDMFSVFFNAQRKTTKRF